jgi:Short C-terminal domain
MKKLVFLALICPLLSTAQNNLPRFEKDTLYTSGGYKIYKGQTLKLGTGTSDAGYFTFIKFHPTQIKNSTYTLQNSTLLVSKLRTYKYAGADNNSIRINGTVTYKDGKQEETDIVVNFERATEDYDGLPSELIVPEAYKIKRIPRGAAPETKKQVTVEEAKKQPAPAEIKNLLIADEIKKLFDLYKAGALTKEEYEAQKKKLLEKQ